MGIFCIDKKGEKVCQEVNLDGIKRGNIMHICTKTLEEKEKTF